MNDVQSARNIGVVFLHGGCNMHCRFCISDNALQSLEFDQAVALLGCLAQRGIDTVVLGGGEPLVWPHDVYRMARVAKAYGFLVQVGTNGIALPADYARRPCVDRYVLPLDGARPETHNRLRLWRGSHHALIWARLEKLRAAGREVTVSTVVNAQNLLGLPLLARQLDDYVARGGRLHAWHLYRFIPAGRGGAANAGALDITRRAYDEACARVRTPERPYTIYKRPDMRHSSSVDFFWLEGGRIRVGSEEWGDSAPTFSVASCVSASRSSVSS